MNDTDKLDVGSETDMLLRWTS